MTWQVVAQKDFRDAVRSRWLWVLSLLFVGLITGVSVLVFGVLLTERPAQADTLFGAFASLGFLSLSFTGLVGFVLAFIALVTSYGSLVDEQASGTLKLLLSLPHDRRDVVAGKLAGRSAVVVLPVLAAFLLAIVALAALGVGVNAWNLVRHAGLTALLAIAFVAVGVGVSAGATTNRQATVGTLGLYMLFALFWPLVAQGFPQLVVEVTNRLPGVSTPEAGGIVLMRLTVKYLNPLRAYETLVAGIYYAPAQARLVKAGFFEQAAVKPILDQAVPFYLSHWFILAILVAWVVVPPLLGYREFARRDL